MIIGVPSILAFCTILCYPSTSGQTLSQISSWCIMCKTEGGGEGGKSKNVRLWLNFASTLTAQHPLLTLNLCCHESGKHHTTLSMKTRNALITSSDLQAFKISVCKRESITPLTKLTASMLMFARSCTVYLCIIPEQPNYSISL